MKLRATTALVPIAAATVLALTAPQAQAYVYATDIRVAGILTNGLVPTPLNGTVQITYRLNQVATAGCTVTILDSNANSVATITGGTNMGLNSIIWGTTNNSGIPVSGGNYSIEVTAGAVGFTNWQQISIDANPAMSAYYPWGIDVDKNTNSPYYGRVVMSCSTSGGTSDPKRDGLYKMNADGTAADEGWYGNASYLGDDGGDAATSGQMPNSFGYNPGLIRIGEDDRTYWCDNSGVGAVVACDMQATTNQMVINEGTFASAYSHSVIQGPNNYQTCPDDNLLNVGGNGIRQFDVSALNTTNAAVYICDTGDYQSAGVWMFHMTNGASDPADTTGTQCIEPDLSTVFVTSAGLSVDDNLNVFVGQSRGNGADPLARVFLYSDWNSGVLPPEADGNNRTYAMPGYQYPTWTVGGATTLYTAIWDTVINSRTNPTMVAVCMAAGYTNTGGYNNENGGISVLSAVDGSTIETNLDYKNWYNGVAFDNVSNVYGCSRTANLWRAWSPPGGNTNTTSAVEVMAVQPLPNSSTAVSFASLTGADSPNGWDLNGNTQGAPTFVSPNALQMTTTAGSLARSAFYSESKVRVDGFVASFTFQDVNKGAADGVTFCLQNSPAGPNALGGAGGSLGVSGITPSVELEFNIYSGNGLGGVGLAYATGGSISRVVSTSPVNLVSGDPINVTIFYNPALAATFVGLYDVTTGTKFNTTFSGAASNNIPSVLGGNLAWVGFTGGTGGSTAVEQISNFLYQHNISNAVLSTGSPAGGSVPFSWNVASYILQASPTVQGPWTAVSGAVTTNFVTGQAQMTLTPSGPAQFFRLVAP